MQKVFQNPSKLEALAKEKYAIPQFLMMENAAKALADFILDFSPDHLLILCGKGNNGGDGYATARLLQGKCKITLLCLEEPTAEEAKVQYEICRRLGLSITDSLPEAQPSVILDCIYGTGFHGNLPEKTAQLLERVNKSKAIKIACDISSGLAFNADYTITMGENKLALFSDKAKAVSGKILVKEIGIYQEKFEDALTLTSASETNAPIAYLIEENDVSLPIRKNRAAHKGSYGHTAVFCGDKCGAAILSASAAMNFGSGLTSLINIDEAKSRLSQFKISPSLMISESIPKKTTCLTAGPGFTEFSKEVADKIIEWFSNQKAPAALFDAGFLTAPEFPDFLKKLNSTNGARIILTPHLSELSRLLNNIGQDISVASLAENPEEKIKAGKLLNSLFPATSIIMKSANTFIASEGQCYIASNGSQNLAKGGSGDILAGMASALLSQGYSAKDAAITAVWKHADTASKLGSEAYNLTPEKLIDLI